MALHISLTSDTIAECANYRVKTEIFYSRKLKGTGISIAPDLTIADSDNLKTFIKNKFLKLKQKIARQYNFNAFIKNSFLYVKEISYSNDKLQENPDIYLKGLEERNITKKYINTLYTAI